MVETSWTAPGTVAGSGPVCPGFRKLGLQAGISLGVLLCLGLMAPAAASEDPTTDALWEMHIAAFGRYGPSYPASETSQGNFVPLPFPVYRGTFLRVGDDRDSPIRGRVFRTDRIKLDIDFDLVFGSDSDDIAARAGMPDLDLLLELGPELELQFVDRGWLAADAFLAFQVRGAFSWDGLDPAYEGLVYSTELKFTRELGDSGRQAKLRITPTFASAGYMDYYYEVTPAFATTERAAFAADGGYLGTEIALSLRFPVARRLELWGGVRQGFYGGARNEDSPLFTDAATTTFYGAFMYRFWESERRAETAREK
jgi:outer membrane scaffolding protein for murein synthesis (MipA/OmpV family)